jgi:hypothetical protein
VGGFSRSATCSSGQMSAVVPPPQPQEALTSKQVSVDKTAAARPLFLVHMPASPGKVAQFTLATEGANGQAQQIHKVTFPLTNKAGVVGIALPTAQSGLQVGKKYLWQMALVCDPANRSSDKVISGWVERTAPPATGEALATLAEQGFWQDVVTRLALQRYRAPQDATAAADWADVMEDGGLPELKQAAIVQIVQN